MGMSSLVFGLELSEEHLKLMGAVIDGLEVVLEFGFGHWEGGEMRFECAENIFILDLIKGVCMN